MSNPVQEFLKLARATRVKPHMRSVGGKSVAISGHSRTTEDAAAEAADREKALRARQSKEFELWRAWKAGGMQPHDLRPLLKSFAPLLRNKMNTHLGRVRMVPDAAIKAEYQVQFVNALRSYDPAKGSLGTYIYRYLDKSKRFIAEHQNVGRIPENRIYKIKAFTTARDKLSAAHGRQPTQPELVEELGWSKADVQRMDSELRNDLVSQHFEEDPFQILPSKEQEVLRLFKYQLEGLDKDVYAYLTGQGKPQITSTSEIAEKLEIPDYQVSRIKASIKKRLLPYLNN